MSLDAHRHKKQLGQHFLHDDQVVGQIIGALQLKPQDRVIEIGPGGGALTFPLLRAHGALTVIEFDRDLIEPLRARAQALGQFEIIHADVLEVDFTHIADGRRLRLVGNLPYNISTPILFHVLEHAAVIEDMLFMLQKEVVARMGAAPGGREFGRLSVMLQAVCRVQPLFVVPPQAFQPPPKVDSAVVRLQPDAALASRIHDHNVFAKVVKQAFAQRRKTLRNTLAGLFSATELSALDIDPGARAETLPVEAFIRLGNQLHASAVA